MASRPSCGKWLRNALLGWDSETVGVSLTGEWKTPINPPAELVKDAEQYAAAIKAGMVRSDQSVLREWLSMLGALTANGMTANDARAKTALYAATLADYPAILFTQESLKELAAKCKFLPSYAELVDFLDMELERLKIQRDRSLSIAQAHYVDVQKLSADKAIRRTTLIKFLCEKMNKKDHDFPEHIYSDYQLEGMAMTRGFTGKTEEYRAPASKEEKSEVSQMVADCIKRMSA
jgi:hypothetical protein